MVIVDDIVDTAGTITALSQKFADAGANNIYVCASHGVFNENAMLRIENSPVKRVVVTNSLPMPKQANGFVSSKVEQVSIAPMLAHVILAEHFSGDQTSSRPVDEDFHMDD